MRRPLSLLALLLALLTTGAGATAEFPEPVEMRQLVGERLEYRILWGALPVGTASMEVGVGPLPWLVEMRSTAESLPVLKWIYPVEDRAISRAASANLRAKEYIEHSKEGFGEPESRRLRFDHTNGAVGTVLDGRRRPWLPIPPNVLDPLSAIYAYRTHPAPGGRPPELPITDGEKVIIARMKILGLERLQVPAGDFDTVVVEPQIEELGGIFRRSPGARIRLWITRDRWRRLVRMQTKVAIGTVTVELTGMRPPTGAPPPGVLAERWEREETPAPQGSQP